MIDFKNKITNKEDFGGKLSYDELIDDIVDKMMYDALEDIEVGMREGCVNSLEDVDPEGMFDYALEVHENYIHSELMARFMEKMTAVLEDVREDTCSEDPEEPQGPTYKLDLDGDYEVCLRQGTYASNGRPALLLYDKSGEVFATISVNLANEECPKDHFFADTNNCPWVEEFLQESGIAEPTGVYGSSGFCTYPLYRIKGDLCKIVREA